MKSPQEQRRGTPKSRSRGLNKRRPGRKAEAATRSADRRAGEGASEGAMRIAMASH